MYRVMQPDYSLLPSLFYSVLIGWQGKPWPARTHSRPYWWTCTDYPAYFSQPSTNLIIRSCTLQLPTLHFMTTNLLSQTTEIP